MDTVRNVGDALVQDIYMGHLPPGARLKQIQLERRYGCSRIILRQALDAAAIRGIVKHEPNRGYSVDVFDEARVAQLVETRAILEIAAAQAVIPFVTPDYLRHLRDLATEAERLGARTEEGVAANLAFHGAMLAPCPNRALVDLIFELRHRLPASVARNYNTDARVDRLMAEHQDMVDALEAGDGERLGTLLRSHIVLRN